jgi:hypothetical protein
MKKLALLIFVFFAFGAFLGCESPSPPCLNIKKEVSVDEGVTFVDANSPQEAPIVGEKGAIYKVTFTNCGNVPLYPGRFQDEALKTSRTFGVFEPGILTSLDPRDTNGNPIPIHIQCPAPPAQNVAKTKACACPHPNPNRPNNDCPKSQEECDANPDVTAEDSAWVRCKEGV